MFSVILLVCGIATARADCTRETAIDVTQGPKVANELMCGRDGQAMIAGTAIRPRADEYLKISCVRDAERG